MTRQFWLFMTDGDEEQLLGAVDAVDPGTLVLAGRYVRGPVENALAAGVGGLEFPSLTRREARRYVFHRHHSAVLTTFPVDEGPLAGTRFVDESRSDCLMLVRPAAEGRRLAPAKLVATVTRHAAAAREKRTHSFVAWAARVLKALKARYPATSVDFMRVAPGARAFVEAGGELTYLHQRIELG